MAPAQRQVNQFYSERKSVTRALKLENQNSHFQEEKNDKEVLSSPLKCKSIDDIDKTHRQECFDNGADMPPPQRKSLSARKSKNPTVVRSHHETLLGSGEMCTEVRRTRSRSTTGINENINVNENCTDGKYVSPATTPSKRKNHAIKDPCSPPKMKYNSESPSGATASASVATTPSTLLSNLQLTSPVVKPKSKSSFLPKSLFPDPDEDLGKARLALHTHTNTSLPGREKELAKLNDFVQSHLKSETSGALYISGPPGTGKTACLTKVLEQTELKERCKVVSINCTSVESPKTIYSRIVDQLNLKVKNKSGKAYLAAIEEYLPSHHKMILMVLDEMDQLDTRSQSVLYSIFEWPLTYPCGIMLIGIANALDLTDRMLPRLKAKLKLSPELLHFAPYDREQLHTILMQRLEEASVLKLFHPAALKLLASKVSAVNGDARRALDTARRTVETESQKIFDFKENHPTIPNACTPSKVHLQIHSTSEQSSPRKSPRKAVSVASLQHQGKEKQDETPLFIRGKSPIKSPLKSNLKSPDRKHLADLKENCSPSKPKSAKKLFVNLENDMKGCTARQSVGFSGELSQMREPCIDVKSILNIVNDVYGSSQSLGRVTDGGEELPLHQKLAISTLLLILRESKNKDVTVGKLHDVYRRVCKKRHFEPLDFGSFLSMLCLVESRGILLLRGRGPQGRLTKVCMQWIEDEVAATLKDRDLLATILNDRSCL